jgi:DNA (cytosine-5)-methyltransferase 1
MRVVELFAGVGGFRLGFEQANSKLGDEYYKVIWSNQWEPATKAQHASITYRENWNLTETKSENVYSNIDADDIHSNQDISKVNVSEIPNHDLILGGFPCQDYSVAKTLNKSSGIKGVKGVLWWEIHRIIESRKPECALLENVDRLLKSPTSQRGRDFAIMLSALDKLGYDVEWRIITASDYGMLQRRKRVFIFAYRRDSRLSKSLRSKSPTSWVKRNGIFAKAFPVNVDVGTQISLTGEPIVVMKHILDNDDYELHEVSDSFNLGKSKGTPFQSAGLMIDGKFFTEKVTPVYNQRITTLGDILLDSKSIELEYLISPNDMLRDKGWIYQKGAKREPRKGTEGFTYLYSEGPVTFPDALDKPSRTIITGEGGSGASRFKHVVKFKLSGSHKKWLENYDRDEIAKVRELTNLGKNEWVRRLNPVELERLNMMPDNHTLGHSASKRAFLMGNALVVGVVEKLAFSLNKILVDSN